MIDDRPPDDRAPDQGRVDDVELADSRLNRSARDGAGPADPAAPTAKRPWIERIGLAAIAFVMGALLTLMAGVAWVGGEWILAAMSASGALLTLGVGLLTLVRG